MLVVDDSPWGSNQPPAASKLKPPLLARRKITQHLLPSPSRHDLEHARSLTLSLTLALLSPLNKQNSIISQEQSPCTHVQYGPSVNIRSLHISLCDLKDLARSGQKSVGSDQTYPDLRFRNNTSPLRPISMPQRVPQQSPLPRMQAAPTRVQSSAKGP